MISTQELDKLVSNYETKEFIKNDPIQFPHRFTDKRDIEIAGFLASLVAYGKRELFIKKLEQLFKIAQNEPHNFIINFEPKILGDFNYRFGKTEDFVSIFLVLQKLYKQNAGLEELFKHGYQTHKNLFIPVTDYFYENVKNITPGFKFMIPIASNGCAMKRMCMYLRWMIRKEPVDLGIWDFMPTSELFIPLDVHVARVSRNLGLLKRNSNDFKAVIELTDNLKKFDSIDPIKYDFAFFGYGINTH